MPHRKFLAIPALFLAFITAPAKDKKKKPPLPTDILLAQSVLVVVDPTAGTDLQNPNANEMAQEDVEKALMKWGRFSLVQEAIDADLIITVRKGSGKIAEPVIAGVPRNNRTEVLEPTDSGIRIGARNGSLGMPGDPSDPQSPVSGAPHPQLQVGQSQDSFVVYRSNRKVNQYNQPLDTPPLWRCTAKGALHDPDVPAVELFRELIAETEKLHNATP